MTVMDNKDFIDRMYEWLGEMLKAFWKFCLHYAKETEKADLIVEPQTVFLIAGVILFFFGSACWAASIAQARRHNPWAYFIIGLIIPWVAPFLMLFCMDLKGNREMKSALKAMEKQERKEKELAEKKKAEEEQQEMVAAEKRAKSWGPEYFNSIARKENGDYAGPWDVAYKGRKVHVLRILEVLPEVVSVEISAAHGETSRIRIPYTTLESWENDSVGE